MSNEGSNKATIGAFVVGAVVLAVIGVVIFGSGKLFTQAVKYVMYFEDSVKGLNMGAPVVLQGVKIGEVVNVTVRADPKDWKFLIPVTVQIYPDKIEKTKEIDNASVKKNLDELIKAGLRARLNIQSIVTGQLLIELEFLPDEEARLVGGGIELPEVPTVQSQMTKVTQALSKLPIGDIFDKLDDTLTAVKKLVESPEIDETVDNLNHAVAEVRSVARTLSEHSAPLIDSIQQTVDHADALIVDTHKQIKPLSSDARAALQGAGKMFTMESGEPARVAESLRKAADAIAALANEGRPAVNQAGKAMRNITSITAKGSKDRYSIEQTLKELSDAARSIRIWAEYLERHPEALISGKGGPTRR